MLLSDLVARRLFAPTELPVGVVTGIVGAPYLLWLLARANRVGRAARLTMSDRPLRSSTTPPIDDAPRRRRLAAADDARRPGPVPRLRRPRGRHRAVGRDPDRGKITVIVGPNACGKSTLLRALARLLKPKARRGPARRHVDPPPADEGGGDEARDPAAVTGRPGGHHRRRPRRPRPLPAPGLVPAVDGGGPGRGRRRRCEATGTLDIAARPVDELSGGQRQRVWIAMTLAQGTGLMLLDEPTTYLDLAHQVDILDLLVDLNQREGRTIVLVLHDLNHACRYAHHLIAMRDGAIVAEGSPDDIVTPELVTDVFGLPCRSSPTRCRRRRWSCRSAVTSTSPRKTPSPPSN